MPEVNKMRETAKVFTGFPGPSLASATLRLQLSHPCVLQRGAGQLKPRPRAGTTQTGEHFGHAIAARVQRTDSNTWQKSEGEDAPPSFMSCTDRFKAGDTSISWPVFNHADRAPQRHLPPFNQQHRGISVANICVSLSAWIHGSWSPGDVVPDERRGCNSPDRASSSLSKLTKVPLMKPKRK